MKSGKRNQTSLHQEQSITWTFGPHWNTYLRRYLNKCVYWDIKDPKNVVFFKHWLTHDLNGKQWYENMVRAAQQNDTKIDYK